MLLACVASVSVDFFARLRHFSLIGCAKIGASATKAKNASIPRKALRKRLLRRLQCSSLLREAFCGQPTSETLQQSFSVTNSEIGTMNVYQSAGPSQSCTEEKTVKQRRIVVESNSQNLVFIYGIFL